MLGLPEVFDYPLQELGHELRVCYKALYPYLVRAGYLDQDRPEKEPPVKAYVVDLVVFIRLVSFMAMFLRPSMWRKEGWAIAIFLLVTRTSDAHHAVQTALAYGHYHLLVRLEDQDFSLAMITGCKAYMESSGIMEASTNCLPADIAFSSLVDSGSSEAFVPSIFNHLRWLF